MTGGFTNGAVFAGGAGRHHLHGAGVVAVVHAGAFRGDNRQAHFACVLTCYKEGRKAGRKEGKGGREGGKEGKGREGKGREGKGRKEGRKEGREGGRKGGRKVRTRKGKERSPPLWKGGIRKEGGRNANLV
jgi:hypothetical protein